MAPADRYLLCETCRLVVALLLTVFLQERRDGRNKIIPFCSLSPLSLLFADSQETFAMCSEGHYLRRAVFYAQLWLAAALLNYSASIFPISKVKLEAFCYILATK